MANRQVSVCMYRDSTDLYSEEELWRSNLEDFTVPGDILRLWHSRTAEIPYEDWLNEYTADDTDGLYQFSIEHGFKPIPTGYCL